MSRESRIQYNPALSVKENAKRNGVSDAAIRAFLKTHCIDRRHDRKQNIIEDCRKYLKKHPNATWDEVQKKTGHSLSTIRKYREDIITEKELIDFDKEKAKKYQEQQASLKERQFALLETIPTEVILEYLSKREEREQTGAVEEKPKIEEVTILDGIPFKPYEEFRIPVNECIQFHSKALPENQILSNHFDCVIAFRGVEFYALEQMYMALNYSDSPGIVKKIMACNSGLKAKSLCNKQYPDKKDWDFEEKRYRIIALCHLYKYLSVKEYRDRLRETYPQTLVECPNGKDYHFGMVQNLETNVFEGNNCSGRTTMIVRDRMIALENEAVKQRQGELGRELTPGEREDVYKALYARIREQFDNDSQVLKDSKTLFTIIEKQGIPKEKTRRPKPFVPPTIDRETKCLVMDFDDTLFDTSADDAYRKGKEKDMEKAMAMIPEYRLYDGWQDVIDWAKKNGVKIGILSAASGKLIEKALKHFQIPHSAIIGYQPYIEKPNTILGNMLMEKLNVRQKQIIYVGNSERDEVQARASQFRFLGATWHSNHEDYFTEKGIQTISSPRDIIPIMEEAGWTEKRKIESPKPVKEVTKRAIKPISKATSRPIKQEYPIEGTLYRGVLGGIIGDIVGSSREGYKQNTFKTDFKLFTTASTLTDDTVLTIAIADWLLHKDTLTVKQALLYWSSRFPKAGYGKGFQAFIKNKGIGYPSNSTANGAAMRICPVALRAESLEEAISLAEESAIPTHTESGITGAQAIAAAIFIAKNGTAQGSSIDAIKAEIKSTVEKRFGYDLNRSIDEIRAMTQEYIKFKEGTKQSKIPSLFYQQVADANLSCPVAIIAALNANTYEEALRIAVSCGGDSDTIADMAGAIASQLFGVPESLVKRSLVFLPVEMIEIINEFEGSDFKPTGIAPHSINRWTNDECIVYGEASDGLNSEEGKVETLPSRFNHFPKEGYPILTVGRSLEEIQTGVAEFIQYAKANPGKRFIVRKVGYHRAGYTIQQIAPMFKEAVGLKNVLLPEEMLNELTNE